MTVPRGPDSLQEQPAGYAAIRGYFVDLVARKTREPGGDDLLSALVAVRDEGQRLDEDELLGMAWLLLTAGHSTTVDLIGNGTLALLRNPDQHAALRADPSRLPAAIEEMVRYDGPIELGISRFTLLFPIILTQAVAPPVMNWWSQRIWMVDPQLAALSDLIYVFAMLRGELSLAKPDAKDAAIRRLRRAGRAVGRGLPRTVALGNGPARQVFADRCRAAGRSIDALCLWVALPRHDTHLVLRRKLAVIAAALATGRYDELPADPPLTESVPQRFRRLVHVLRSLVVAAVPLLGVYLARRLGIHLDGVLGGAVVAFCVAWATVTCLPLLEPAWTERLASVRDLFGTLRSTTSVRHEERPH
jgi:hypothetical protein